MTPIDPSRTATMEDGQVVNLKDLIDDMTQMATAAGLQAQSFFFMDSDTAELIVDWVETGVMGDELGLLIRRVVRPCPLISIASEHDVHEANALTQTKSSKKSEQLVSAQVTLRLNEHLSQVRRAFDLFIASSEREATAKFRRDVSSSWRRRGQAPKEATAASTINKYVLFQQLQLERERAKKCTPQVQQNAKAEGRARKAAKTDHGSHIKNRKEAAQKSRRKRGEKTADAGRSLTPAALHAGGAAIIPVAARDLQSNNGQQVIDLDNPTQKTASKSILTAELKARKKDTYLKVQSGPNAGQPAASVTVSDLIALLRAANGGGSKVVRLTDEGDAPKFAWKRRAIAPPPAPQNAESPETAATEAAVVIVAAAIDQSQENPDPPPPPAAAPLGVTTRRSARQRR